MASGSSADMTMTLEVAKLLCQQQVSPQPLILWPSQWIQQQQKKTRRNLQRHLQVVFQERDQVRHRRQRLLLRQSSASLRMKAGERRPSKTVMQCLQTTVKANDREPRSPEQMKSRFSRNTLQKPTSPAPLARVQSAQFAGTACFSQQCRC